MIKDDMKYDIMKELFNISVGKAANMLSDIVNRKIVLSVPDIDFGYDGDKIISVDEFLPELISGSLMVSSISFKEEINGKANLIFSAEKMKEFIRLCTNEESNDSENNEFTDIDFDIIKEIGNIILNCIMGETGNFLGVNFSYSIPEVKIFERIDLNRDIKENGYSHVLILHISFMIDETEIEGAILVDLTVNSMNELINKLESLEAGIDA